MEKEQSTEENLPTGGNKKNQKESRKEEIEGELRMYEISYLLLPFILEEDTPKEVERLKDHISISGGTVFSEEEPKLIKLAYSMFKIIANKSVKFDGAYFGWFKFECESGNLSKIKKAFEGNGNILRFLILKTTKENIASRKQVSFPIKPPKSAHVIVKDETKSKVENSQEINEADLDKTIEDLVIE